MSCAHAPGSRDWNQLGRCNFLESDPKGGWFGAGDGELARRLPGAEPTKGPPSGSLSVKRGVDWPRSALARVHTSFLLL